YMWGRAARIRWSKCPGRGLHQPIPVLLGWLRAAARNVSLAHAHQIRVVLACHAALTTVGRLSPGWGCPNLHRREVRCVAGGRLLASRCVNLARWAHGRHWLRM